MTKAYHSIPGSTYQLTKVMKPTETYDHVDRPDRDDIELSA